MKSRMIIERERGNTTCADFRVSLKVNQSFLLAEYATFEVTSDAC